MNESFIVEAESTSLDTYFIEGNASASGEELISLGTGFLFDTGSASLNFEGDSEEYDVLVRYLDRRDGIGQLRVEQNGNTLDSWNFDRSLFNFSADRVSIEERTIATGIDIDRGDNFTLTGREYWFEGMQVDYVEFIPVNSDPSVLALGESILAVNEEAGTIDVPVERTGNLNQTVAVDFRTFEETASAEDFTASEGSLTFEPGETIKNITIAIADDEIVDPDETFF